MPEAHQIVFGTVGVVAARFTDRRSRPRGGRAGGREVSGR